MPTSTSQRRKRSYSKNSRPMEELWERLSEKECHPSIMLLKLTMKFKILSQAREKKRVKGNMRMTLPNTCNSKHILNSIGSALRISREGFFNS
jgi:hypothetical protein